MIKPKTAREIQIIREGGKKLAKIKGVLKEMIIPGALPSMLDRKAEKLVYSAGGKPSFKMVKGYHWTTCINVNDGVVHGVPGEVPLQKGDIVSVDVGIFYKGFHTDSAFTVPVGDVGWQKRIFLAIGEDALARSIAQAQAGRRISDISMTMQEVIEAAGYCPVRSLTGHGVGRKLHEEPQIPCFWQGDPEDSEIIPEGAVLAIEVIYTKGSPELSLSEDGWTIATRDGKIAALFEETIAVVDGKPLVLT